jgi:hypothetical protein
MHGLASIGKTPAVGRTDHHAMTHACSMSRHMVRFLANADGSDARKGSSAIVVGRNHAYESPMCRQFGRACNGFEVTEAPGRRGDHPGTFLVGGPG